MENKNGNCKYLKYVPVLQFADCVTGQVICSNKSYRNDQQDATV
jgi:hypothetical protein